MLSAFIEMLKKDTHIFGLPNILSVCRLLFLPFICHYISLNSTRGNYIALILFMLAAVTDFFDGFVARRWNQFSQLGRILDPVMDKLYVNVLMLFLAVYRDLPYWYIACVIGRDLLILLGSVMVISKKKKVLESVFIGKVTLGLYLLVIFSYLLNLQPYNVIFLWLSVVMIPISFFRYVHIYLKSNKNQASPVDAR
ncbi:CDP-alcohol phosphatidyltransferase family protein [candidate division KSB1 bacterium]|nr:CDP-alcohol phosphatidyltransferase family protein [candidate division KSB1 bacterium]